MGYSPSEAQYKNCFPDVGTEWYARYVCFAKEMGWVEGYSDNTFKPANDVNKAEALKMLLEVFDVNVTNAKANPFTDVPKTEWYAKYVYTAKGMGLLEEAGTYYWPASAISRGQISENIYRLILSLDAERIAFVAAMIEASCLTEGFANPDDPAALALLKSSFATYGLEATEDAINDLILKYENDDEVLTAVGLGIMEQCPEYLPEG